MADNNLYIGRTNYLNDLFSGIFRGAGAVVDTIQANNQNKEMLQEFDKTTNWLKDSSLKVQQQQDAILGLVPTPEGQRQPIQPVVDKNAPTQQDVYSQMVQKGLGMYSKYGENASPYINALPKLYENYFQKPEEPKYNDVTVGNDRYRVDRNGNYIKVLSGEDKPKPKEYTPNEVYSLTIDDILAMPKGNDFIDKNFEAFNPETKKALQDKYPYLIPEVKTTGRGGRRGGTGSYKPTQNVKDTLTSLQKLAKDKDEFANLDDKSKADYETVLGDIASEYGIYGVDELNQLIQDSYDGNTTKVAKKLRAYKDSKQTFDQNISDFNLSDLSNDLYNIETDPTKNPDGEKELYDTIENGRQWVNDYIKNLDNAQANHLLQLYQDLIDNVLKSKFLK